jgi:predicted nuclease with RNAse H fold
VTARFAGIDVGERQLDCALVDAGCRILECTTLSTTDPGELVDWCATAQVAAIDAPATPSTAPHADSGELAPKFRAGRCAEIELGRSHGSWVSWVAPTGPPFPRWMEAGFATYRALAALNGIEVIEVFPHAAFRELAGGRRLARKRSATGRRERAELLARAGLEGDELAPGSAGLARESHARPPADDALRPEAAPAHAPSHDVLDALAAALVALDRFRGRAQPVTCGHDGSAIWLPGPLG